MKVSKRFRALDKSNYWEETTEAEDCRKRREVKRCCDCLHYSTCKKEGE